MIKLFKPIWYSYIVFLCVWFVAYGVITLTTDIPMVVLVIIFLLIHLVVNILFTKISNKKHDRIIHILMDECDPVRYLNEYYPLLSQAGDNMIDFIMLNLSAGYIDAGDFNSARNVLNNVRFQKLSIPMLKCIYYSNFFCLNINTNRYNDAQACLDLLKRVIDDIPKNKIKDKNRVLTLYNSYVCYMNIQNNYFDGVEQQLLICLHSATAKSHMVSYSFLLGELYAKTGRIDEAKRMFEYVISNGNTMYMVKEAQIKLNNLK